LEGTIKYSDKLVKVNTSNVSGRAAAGTLSGGWMRNYLSCGINNRRLPLKQKSTIINGPGKLAI
jgi:hypothetical protein